MPARSLGDEDLLGQAEAGAIKLLQRLRDDLHDLESARPGVSASVVQEGRVKLLQAIADGEAVLLSIQAIRQSASMERGSCP